MRWIIALLGLLASVGRFALAPAQADDHISFGIDWVAEAEYGGYYQALATGLYAKHGLVVTIRQGGPQVNQMQLHAGRAARFQPRRRPGDRISSSRTCPSLPSRRSSRRTRRC